MPPNPDQQNEQINLAALTNAEADLAEVLAAGGVYHASPV
jgi:hypothetical protein